MRYAKASVIIPAARRSAICSACLGDSGGAIIENCMVGRCGPVGARFRRRETGLEGPPPKFDNEGSIGSTGSAGLSLIKKPKYNATHNNKFTYLTKNEDK